MTGCVPGLREGYVTDEGWVKGYGMLVVAFPPRGMSAGEQKARGALYREKLDHLADEQFLRAAGFCIDRERFFPPVAVLLGSAGPKQDPEAMRLPEAEIKAAKVERDARLREMRGE